MDPKPFDPAQRRRGRWMLVGLFALFFGTVFGAGILRFSGWQPASHKNHGVMLQPPADARDLSLTLVDGGRYDWTPAERRWRIVAAEPAAGLTGWRRRVALAIWRNILPTPNWQNAD